MPGKIGESPKRTLFFAEISIVWNACLPGGVMVARQTLTLFVMVRIHAGQPFLLRDPNCAAFNMFRNGRVVAGRENRHAFGECQSSDRPNNGKGSRRLEAAVPPSARSILRVATWKGRSSSRQSGRSPCWRRGKTVDGLIG